MSEQLYGVHPIYAAGGDVGVEQDIIYLALRRRHGKARVHGVGATTVVVAGVTVNEASVALSGLGYRFVRRTDQGAVLKNLVATVFVFRTKSGVTIDLEATPVESVA